MEVVERGPGGEESMGVSGGWNWSGRLDGDEVVGVANMVEINRR